MDFDNPPTGVDSYAENFRSIVDPENKTVCLGEIHTVSKGKK